MWRCVYCGMTCTDCGLWDREGYGPLAECKPEPDWYPNQAPHRHFFMPVEEVAMS